MHLVYINPNSTQAMTDGITQVARRALPDAQITGLTNTAGPPAIQGAADGDAAIPGVLDLIGDAEAMGADAIIIACFDDTGLAEARQRAACPVLGIGQAAYTIAAMSGGKFSVVTSLAVSIPVIEGNISATGFAGNCAAVRASDLDVLTIEAGSEATRQTLAAAIRQTGAQDGCRSVILGCAGMAPLHADLSRRTGLPLIDGVTASAHLAAAAARTLGVT